MPTSYLEIRSCLMSVCATRLETTKDYILVSAGLIVSPCKNKTKLPFLALKNSVL